MPDSRQSGGFRLRARAARRLWLVVPLGSLAMIAAGCGSLGGRYDSATTAPSPVGTTTAPSGTVRAVTAQPLPLLDPAFADTRQSRAIANALCTPLVRYADAQGLPGTVLVPGLARDLPIVSRSSRTFRVQLLSGVKFADGRKLTTLDVRATFERLLDPATHSPGAALFSDLLGSEAFAAGSAPHLRGVQANRGQVTFTLKRSDPAFLARLAMPLACIVPSGTPHRAVPGLLARDATGRYRVLEHSSAVIDLQRATTTTTVPSGGTPGAAARISITRLPDAAALQTAIRSGSADVSLDDLPGASSPALAVPSTALAVLRLDPEEPPLSDERVRHALSLALDRHALAVSDGGDVVPARSLLLDPQARAALPADPSRARALLRSAGAENTRLDLWAEPGAQARVARSIATQLAAVGVQVTVRVGERPRRRAGLDPVAVPGLRRPGRDLHAARRCPRRRPAGCGRGTGQRRRTAGRRCAPRGLPAPR